MEGLGGGSEVRNLETVGILMVPPRVLAQASLVAASGLRKTGSSSDRVASSNLG